MDVFIKNGTFLSRTETKSIYMGGFLLKVHKKTRNILYKDKKAYCTSELSGKKIVM